MSIELSNNIQRFANRLYSTDDHALFRYGEKWQNFLKPCEPIQDKSICIGMLGNTNLQVSRLMIADYDRKPILVTPSATLETIQLEYPGKSAFILLEPNACDKLFIQNTVKEIFDKDSDRRDKVHVATVTAIEETGWIPFYAPVQMDHLFDHVRIVYKDTITQGIDPTLEDAERLKSVFILIPNLHG